MGKMNGNECFEVRLYGQPPCTKRLLDMSTEEVLAVANTADEPTRSALYRWQYEHRRRARPDGSPRAA